MRHPLRHECLAFAAYTQLRPTLTLRLTPTQDPDSDRDPDRVLSLILTPTLRAGLDSAELVSQMRAAHASEADTRAGVDVVRGMTGDMQELGIYEAFKARTCE